MQVLKIFLTVFRSPVGLPNSEGKRRRKGGSGNLIAPLPLSPPPSVPRHNYGMRGTNYDLFPPFLVRRGRVLLQWREGIPAAQTHPQDIFWQSF